MKRFRLAPNFDIITPEEQAMADRHKIVWSVSHDCFLVLHRVLQAAVMRDGVAIVDTRLKTISLCPGSQSDTLNLNVGDRVAMRIAEGRREAITVYLDLLGVTTGEHNTSGAVLEFLFIGDKMLFESFLDCMSKWLMKPDMSGLF